jgi:N-acetylglucosamine-6-sulfatase
MVTGVAMMSRWAALAATAAVAAGLLAVDSDNAPGSASGAAPAPDDRPNIVLVLMDDASMDLVQTMTSAARMRREGASYRKSFVVDSLCCVSRASLFTGQYPHQTRVRTNTANLPNPVGPMGGWEAFRSYGNRGRSFNTRLQASGYRTALIGKYLNDYEGNQSRTPSVPRGWSDFRPFFGSAYDEWDFWWGRSLNGGPLQTAHVTAPPSTAPRSAKDRAYAGRLIGDQAIRFITSKQVTAKPYFLEIAVYAPHSRIIGDPMAYPDDPFFPPMFRDRPGPGRPLGNCGLVGCGQLTVADLPGWHDDRADNVPRHADGTRARSWQSGNPVMTSATALVALRDRAQMVQPVDRMVRRILRIVDDNTFVILTSDNGFHLGQVGMGMGKGTAYTTDIRVPLFVVGPGVAPGSRRELVSNIDLAPTFEELAGLTPASYRSGVSLVPTFSHRRLSVRDYVFIEHTWSETRGSDPDRLGTELARIPSYTAVRSATALLVRMDLDNRPGYTNYAYEFYDYTEDPWERTNTYAAARQRVERDRLLAKLRAFERCSSVRRSDPVPARCIKLTLADGAVAIS